MLVFAGLIKGVMAQRRNGVRAQWRKGVMAQGLNGAKAKKYIMYYLRNAV
jgi:hypothetical protein